MSTTRMPMLSTTHAVLRGLQDELCEIIRDLPDSVPPSLKQGLTDAHHKLSDYYYKIDTSPYYLWSSCECYKFSCAITCTHNDFSLRPAHIL